MQEYNRQIKILKQMKHIAILSCQKGMDMDVPLIDEVTKNELQQVVQFLTLSYKVGRNNHSIDLINAGINFESTTNFKTLLEMCNNEKAIEHYLRKATKVKKDCEETNDQLNSSQKQVISNGTKILCDAIKFKYNLDS